MDGKWVTYAEETRVKEPAHRAWLFACLPLIRRPDLSHSDAARALFETVVDPAMVFLGRDGRVQEVNRGAQLLLGRPARLAAIFPDLGDGEVARALRETAANGVFSIEAEAAHADGRRFWARAVLSRLADGDLVLLLRDASRSKSEQQRELAARDQTVSKILDQMPCILSMLDRELRFTSLQGAGLRAVNGEIQTELLGQNVNDVLSWDETAVQAFDAALRGESASFSSVWRDRHYENRVEPLRNAAGEIVGVMNLGVDMTERVLDEQALAASREELRRLSAHLNELQEEERRRIAHELHDELGQQLTALRMEASLLPHKLGKRMGAAASEAIASMIGLIDGTIDTVRRVATELRPPILDDFGFRAAVELELSALQKRSGIGYDIDFAPDDLHVDRDRATTLYRIVQESLTNVARHSRATFVRVSVAQQQGSLVLRIADDGRGITAAERTGSASLGLLGIRERAHAHGGEADIRAGERGGTVVEVRLPATRLPAGERQ